MKLRDVLALSVLISVAACSEPASEPAPEPGAGAAPAEEATAEPSVDEQFAALVASCEAAAPAIEARQAESSLYDRLGGRDGIRALMEHVVEVHADNPEMAPYFTDVDIDRFLENTTDFLVIGAGGEADYQGRDIVELHSTMNITPEVFLQAGGDFQIAMNDLGIGEDEAQEVVCALVSLRGMVMATEG
jgi:hemoglobin